jgi:tRNA-specific 2-thiouridylase
MKIAVLVSGGVDSSVALRILKDQGYDVTAFYLKIWLEDELSFLGSCPWEDDLEVVHAVCKQAEVPLHVLPFQKEYHDTVVAYTINEIKHGRTPNPDILCNQYVKFGAFIDALKGEFDYIASGHYAQLAPCNGCICLKKAPDPIKDQTYFLSQLSQDQLKKLMFPIGYMPKYEVRKKAEAYNLPNKDRKDSQGICFLGKLKFSEFVRFHIGDQEGDIIEFETNEKKGTHKGFWYYTIGQRQGLGLSGGPWYVVKKDTDKNIVYISRQYYSPDKKRNTFFIHHCNWMCEPLKGIKSLSVKLRHGPDEHPCTVEYVSDDYYKVVLNDRDQGIAPGQFAVFYDQDICVASGVIVQSAV